MSQKFLFFCLSFILGVFFGRFLSLILVLISAALFSFLVTVFWGNKKIVFIGALGLIVFFGSFWFLKSLPDRKSNNFISQFYDQDVVIEAIVWDELEVRNGQARLRVKPVKVISQEIKEINDEISGDILVTTGRYPEFNYGDRLLIETKLEEPFESEEFSYKDFLARFGIHAVARFPEIEKLEENQGQFIKAQLFIIKNKFRKSLSQVLPEPQNALALGLLLGLKETIPRDLNEAFIITGVSHIVVVSGYNISILTRSLLRTRFVWGRQIALSLSVLIVLGFVIITGAEASVVRAAIMGLILVSALYFGRVYYVVNALVFAATIMLVFNPQILHFDIGFQLSFAATLGLVFLSPIFDKWFWRLPNILQFRTNLASTLAAQIFTLPLLIFYFDRISVIAPLVNVLILWVIPYAMLAAFTVGLIGIIYLPAAAVIASIPWLILKYQVEVVEFFARLQFAARSLEINLLVVIIYYALLISALAYYRYKKQFNYYLEYFDEEI